jgi:hypothetical protein
MQATVALDASEKLAAQTIDLGEQAQLDAALIVDLGDEIKQTFVLSHDTVSVPLSRSLSRLTAFACSLGTVLCGLCGTDFVF